MPVYRLVLSGVTAVILLLQSLVVPQAWSQERDRNVIHDSTMFHGLRYRMVGPYRGGRSTAATGVAGRPHTFFQGTTGGGVWKTTDAGNSWANVSDGFFGGSIGAVAVAPSDHNVIYVGQGSADIRGNTSTGRGVYRSTDGGKTWTYLGLRNAGQVGRIEVHPRDPDLVYVAALGHPFGRNPERGVFRSRDGGATWEHVLALSDSTGASDLAMSFDNPRVLYAAMWRGERKPWAVISGSEEGGVYRTTDGGGAWKKLEGGLPPGLVGKIGVTASRANPERVWAIIQAEPDGGVYRSDDGGDTWTHVNSENKLRQRAFYYTHVQADPQDENTVYALNTRLYKSVDGGATFELIEVPHGDVHDLWIYPDNNRIMVVANDGGAQVTLNGGETWSSYMNQPTAELYDVIVDNAFPYRLYGGQQDNTTISVLAWSSSNTLHPKEHWQNVGGCETGPVGVHPDHPEVVYGGCYGGIIDRYDMAQDQRRYILLYPQEQSGEAARNLKYRFQWVSPILVSPHDPSVVYHASQYVHRTTDGGMTWETISPDLTTNTLEHQDYAGGPIDHDITGVEVFNTIFSLAESPHTVGELWAGSDDGRVHVSRDNGATWTDVTPRGMPRFGTVDEIELSPHQPGRAFLAVQRYRTDDWAPYVFRTDDYGDSWRLLTDGRNGLPADYPVRTVREDPVRQGLLYAGTEFGVFVSFNDGRNWQSLQLNMPVTPVTGMRAAHGDLILATQGRSFWILDDVTPLRQLSAEVAASPFHLYAPRDAYRVNARGGNGGPEPTPEALAGNALIYYYLAQEPADAITLEVRAGDGGLVRTFTSDSAGAASVGQKPLAAEAGMHRLAWDLTYPGPDTLSGVVIAGWAGGVKTPPGSYQVRLTVGGEIQTRDLTVHKDPRLTDVTQQDFEEQFRVAVAIRDTVSRLYDAARDIRGVKQQLATVRERVTEGGFPEEIAAAADSLVSRLTAAEEELRQVKNESNQDPLRYAPKLDTQYLALYAHVTGVDNYGFGGPEGRPTEGAYQRFEDLNAEWSVLRDRVQAMLQTDVPAFNRMLQDAGVPGVIVPSLGAQEARPIP
jgi:photosystem II stability/assembly factor-like uncharacterized protein